MVRSLRIEYENALYHVVSRGIRQEAIFLDDEDRQLFLDKLSLMVDKFRIIILSYALMQNHYHLLIETPHANLSRTMHYLNSCYVNWFRAKYKLVGSVLQGRFYASLIEKEAYLDVASAYIHLNPLRAGIVHFPDQYQWSSYASLMRKTPFPPWLSNDIILGEFSGDVNDYERFVMECFFQDKISIGQ